MNYGLKLVKKDVVKCSVDEFDSIRERLVILCSMRKLSSFYVPYDDRIERVMVRMFTREGKRLSKSVEIFEVSRKRWLRLYKFNKTFIMLERKGDMMIVRFSSDVDKWMRFALVKGFFILRSSMVRFVEMCDDIVGLHVLSDMWREFQTTNNVLFGPWLVRQKQWQAMIRRGNVMIL